MGHDTVEGPKRKLEGKELENYLRIKKRLEDIWLEDAKLRAELDAMGLKFERKWWHGPIRNCSSTDLSRSDKWST